MRDGQRLNVHVINAAKIGKDEAIKDFNDIIKPLVASRPDAFGSSDYYSEDLYNQMGSLILSRSFHVDDPEDDDDEEEETTPANESKDQAQQDADASNTSLLQAAESMDIHNDNGLIEEDEASDDGEDEQEEVKHISMVPWADMLNASHGRDNARLFYEKESLNMTTTKPIKRGEQIVRQSVHKVAYANLTFFSPHKVERVWRSPKLGPSPPLWPHRRC